MIGAPAGPLNRRCPRSFCTSCLSLLLLCKDTLKRVMGKWPAQLFSLLLFPLHAGRDPARYFFTNLLLAFPCIAFQLGPVGVMCVLDDFGTTENAYAAYFEPALRGQTLDPLQFWELVGRLSYISWLMPFEFSYSRLSRVKVT